MFVDKDDFKVSAHFISYDSGHWCYIYDSATHVWSSLPNLPFSQREERHGFDARSVFPDFYDPSILGLYDFVRTKWITGEVVRSLRITTGLEGVEQSGEFLRCVLPRPEDNLVIFSEGKVFVYDLDTERWGGVGRRTYESGKGLLYRPVLTTLCGTTRHPK
ncbi:hypothetical protein SELMODRAFT_414114 [Selaginella moellendorffii]|uniref:Uncharacterized protein n=1 Tax=Selaginella moellendorffii TaxID=88036 RepID=D8RRP4_SELML|nr:hypothetical protein SELMODRAFT_414114 [Selaginella moellendorffii]